MRIVYVTPGVGTSGGMAVICQHTNRLQQRGHEVYIAMEEKGVIDWFPNQRTPVISFQEYPADVDILVATGWQTTHIVTELPARKKFYFVQSDETRFFPEGSPWTKISALTYRLNFNYFTEAHWIQKWLKDNFGHDSELIPNGLDFELFHQTEPLEPKGEKPRVLLEGAIGLPFKGMADAFAAVADLDAEVWCVSSYGEPQPGWKCDRFFQRIPMTEMKDVYSSCDILLKLSRVEGFFGPPMEMMACGGASVVGKVTGYDEYIVDGYNALAVELGDVAAARAAVQMLISDSGLREKIIKNGFETAKEWPWEPSIDRLEKHFQDMLAGNRPSKHETSVNIEADKAIALAFTMRKEYELDLLDKILHLKGLLAEKDSRLAEKDNQLAEKDRHLSAIYDSFAWRLIQPLRRMLERSRGTWLERFWLFMKSRLR